MSTDLKVVLGRPIATRAGEYEVFLTDMPVVPAVGDLVTIDGQALVVSCREFVLDTCPGFSAEGYQLLSFDEVRITAKPRST